MSTIKSKTYVAMYKRIGRGKSGPRPVAAAITQGRQPGVHEAQNGTAVPGADQATPIQTSARQHFTVDDPPRKKWLSRSSFLLRHHG